VPISTPGGSELVAPIQRELSEAADNNMVTHNFPTIKLLNIVSFPPKAKLSTRFLIAIMCDMRFTRSPVLTSSGMPLAKMLKTLVCLNFLFRVV